MDLKLLESAEFYRRRYNNFSTMIIIPLLGLLVAIVIFSVFGKKEVVVKSVGEIRPTKIVSTIQSTSSSPIIENKLVENRSVKVGSVLIKYNARNTNSETNLLQQQIKVDKQQLAAIKLLQKGLTEGKNTFIKPDKFGYNSILEDYLVQLKLLDSAQNVSDKQREQTDTSATKVKNNVTQQIKKNEKKLASYKLLLKSIKQQHNQLPKHDELQVNYQLYVKKIKKASTGEKVALKSENISNTQQIISQLQDAITSDRSQIAGIASKSVKSNDVRDKATSLKAEQLLGVSKERNNIQMNLQQLNTKLRLQQNTNRQNTLTSPGAGVIHIDEQNKGQSMIPVGSVVAQLYPQINKAKKVNIETYISAADVVTLKKHQLARFTLEQSVPKPIILIGRISSIADAPTATSKGNVFKVVVSVQVNRVQLRYLRYGLEGKLVVITGTKTLFNYYKDKVFNQ
jgi:competence factor transport accessory protein ComB